MFPKHMEPVRRLTVSTKILIWNRPLESSAQETARYWCMTETRHLLTTSDGRASFFPEHVGMPLTANNGPEYYLLQTHYDNPNVEPNLRVTFSLHMYYSSIIRPYEAGMITLGTVTPGSTTIIVPPGETDHKILGMCAPGCTEIKLFPEKGLRLLWLRFLLAYSYQRGNTELPWILTDENYDFNYQQYRVLREERKVLPGDLLINSCTYDTTGTNGTAVVGGFSTRQEMCTAFLWYYTRSKTHAFCRSELKTNDYLNLIGVRTTEWDPERRAMVITSPARYRGITMADYTSNYIDWNLEMREELQRRQIYDPQSSQCPKFTPDAVPTESQLSTEGAPFPTRANRANTANQQPMSSFPSNIRLYEPPSQCARRGDTNRGQQGGRTNANRNQDGSRGQQQRGNANRNQQRGKEGRGWSRN
ncbi:DBH-like monooxygenase protein 1 [Orchesella cincta]|uniref:DBH-like monooxygenase protein 1 n=1 Tax=Orchesella cincta TaxID=48709 RepID=A0A1D2MT60_ORCCI|nr:DBH-like monooxygenase protein 1 [Orchesella cincta]